MRAPISFIALMFYSTLDHNEHCELGHRLIKNYYTKMNVCKFICVKYVCIYLCILYSREFPVMMIFAAVVCSFVNLSFNYCDKELYT